MSSGEKVPPVDMTIRRCPVFEPVMVLGEGKSDLGVFVARNPDHWAKVAAAHGLDADSKQVLRTDQVEEIVLERVSAQIHAFYGHTQVRACSRKRGTSKVACSRRP